MKIDKYNYNEFIDRTYILLNNLNENIINYPVAKKKKYKKKLKKIEKKLFEIYQIAGKDSIKNY